jgi:hypothetical protein
VTSTRDHVRFAAGHAAWLVALWLAAVVVYAVGFAPNVQWAWVFVDIVLVAGSLVSAHRLQPRALAGCLGDRAYIKLGAAFAIALLGVIATHSLVADANGIWLDETNYLRTLREGHIVADGVAPFNMRWLEPMLAGPLNIFPVSDADALKALNFGAFVVSGVYLVLLLVRMRVRFVHAVAAPIFLLCSYLGTYGAHNRLVVDPFNYAMYIVLFHVLLRREHWRYFPIVLLVATCNSEKAIYWLPLFAVLAMMQTGLRAGLLLALRHGAPTLVYLAAMALYLRHSHTEDTGGFSQNLHLMSFTWFAGKISNDVVRANNFQILWFPFGAFTMYALLGFTRCERALRPFALLLIPIMLQTLIAHDTQRMVAYAFIVYLPFGYLYLRDVMRDLPRVAGGVIFALLVTLAIAEAFLLVVAGKLDWQLPVGRVRMVLSAAEVVLALGLVALHSIVFDRSPAASADRPADSAAHDAADRR